MPHEEIRKIIKIGNSCGVTIPKSWLRYFNLGIGDSVRVVSDGVIVIEPPPEKKRVDMLLLVGQKTKVDEKNE